MLSGLFVKYNAALLFSVTVKRLFSLRKDVLKQKQSEASAEAKANEALATGLPFLKGSFYGFKICHKTLFAFGKEYTPTF